MAYGDIMPWVSPLGGTYEVRWGIMEDAETFECGEPVAHVQCGWGVHSDPSGDRHAWLHGRGDEDQLYHSESGFGEL